MLSAEEQNLAEQITASRSSGEPVRTALKTDDQVIARITDGIYREPASALRELISNAYDADAKRVIISTDRPRYQRIIVEDDGHGMSPEALAHMIESIGGSAKRSDSGFSLGVTSEEDSKLSPKGRPLIGRIGIGLFSVVQLTQTFQIITKVENDPWRTIAVVNMRQYMTKGDANSNSSSEGQNEEDVYIWREPAQDVSAHGTTVVLNNIRPRTRATLQSADHWRTTKPGSDPEFLFHTGRVQNFRDASSSDLAHTGKLPWEASDDPVAAFNKLSEVAWAQIRDSKNNNPKLEHLFDNYLNTVWKLSVACPLPYVAGNPLGSPLVQARPFLLDKANAAKDNELKLAASESIAQKLSWPNQLGENVSSFRVLIDELELSRPIRVDRLPTTSNAVKSPLLFVGEGNFTFEGQASAQSAGPLRFYAYLLWCPKVAPVDHAGVLVRINGASGTLFDPTFMRYQVAEITRLRQISCEIFVTEGLDSALNIDRESFNYAHPHVVQLANWFHSALTKAINAQKSIANDLRKNARLQERELQASELDAIANHAWKMIARDQNSKPSLVFDDSEGVPNSAADIVLPREKVLGEYADSKSRAAAIAEGKVRSLMQVLGAFGLLDELSPRTLNELAGYVGRIIQVDA